MHRHSLLLFFANRVTILRAVLALAASLAFSASAAAQSSTWTGIFFGVWNQALNWSPNGIPTSATAVNFTGNALGSINISPNGFAQSLSFSNSTGSYTLSSSPGVTLSGVTAINVAAGVTGVQTIDLAGNAGGSLLFPPAGNLTITNNSAALAPTLVIGPNTVIGASGGGSGGVLVNGAGTTQISGGFANVVGALTKNGAGTLILSGGGNSYHGGTSINAGTLRLGAGGALRAGQDVAVGGFVGSAAEFNIDQESNTAATAIAALNLFVGGTFRVPSGDGDYYLNKLEMFGGTVDFSGSGQLNGFWLHLVNSGAAISSDADSTTAKWIGSGNSRIQNDTAAPMTISVAAGNTPSGIDLDAGISLSAGSVGSNPNFTKTGAGTMRLTSLKNTANIRVDQGALRVDNLAANGVGALGSGGIVLNGGTLQYGGPTATTTKGMTFMSSGRIQILSPGVNLTYNGVISESGGGKTLTVLGPGVGQSPSTLTLAGTNNYSGATFVQGNAILAIPTIANTGQASPIGAGSSSVLLGSANSRGALVLTGSNPAYSTNRIIQLDGLYANQAGGAIGVQNTGTNLTVSGQVTDGGSLIKTGAGTLTLTNTTNDYTEGTYVEGGTLVVGADGNVIPANSDVTIFANATFQISADVSSNFGTPVGTVMLDGGAIRIPAGSPLYYANRLATTAAGGAIDLTGSTGKLWMSGSDPRVDINGNSTWTSSNSNSLVVFSNGLEPTDVTIAPAVTLTNSINLQGPLRITGGGTLYMSAPKSGWHNWLVQYTVSQGRLRADDLSVGTAEISNASVLGAVIDQFLTLDGGALQYSGPTDSSPMPITLGAAGGTVEVSNVGSTLTLTGTMSSNGLLTKAGPGVLVLNNLANQYLGGISVSGGRLDVGADAQLGVANPTVNPAGTLRYTASASTARSFTLNGGTLEVPAGVNLTMNGAAVGGGFLRGAGTFALTGGTSLASVTTQTSTAISQTGPASVANFTNGGSFTVAGGQSLAWNGGTNTSAGRLVVGGTANVSNFVSNGLVTINAGGAIANSGAPLVLGGGSRTLIGTAAVPGGAINLGGQSLELNGGLLANNGTITGTTNVNFGSLAQGAGSFGAVNVFNGGKFSPGNSPGTATLASASFNAGGSYLFELRDAAGAPGSGMDFLDISGGLSITAGATPNSQFTIELVSLDAANQPGLASNFNPAQAYSFVLATADAGITGFAANKFKLEISAFANNASGGHFSLAQSGNNLLLSFSPGFSAADFEEDHDVDAQDLATWKSGFGTSVGATHMQGDADADHDVDGADFLVWQRQLGSPVAAVSANTRVPEPTASMLVIVAAAGMRRLGGRMRQELVSA